ncbi:MAG: ABC transporter permease [Syntrophobacteraceae bacterium]|nr:ABC transporter permease [Syntrophobacteraceae bacterium]
MEEIKDPLCPAPQGSRIGRRDLPGVINRKRRLYNLITLAVVVGIWQFMSDQYRSDLLLPPPWKTAKAFVFAVTDLETLKNLLLTLRRVASGFGIALLLGMTFGFLMGYSKTAMQLIDPLMGGLRQVPVMAWVPLTIVWFGLGDGPTVFLIALVGTFPILLNTIAGVQSISKDYFHAARTMGAGSWSLFKDVMVPAALPHVLTGMRLAVSAGWMSVI